MYGAYSSGVEAATAIDAWTREMSEHVKRLAPLALVATGSEGFFARGAPSAGALVEGQVNRGALLASNPVSVSSEGGDPDDRNWASKQGGDFLSNNAHPGVDLAVFHLWRDGRTEKVV